MLMKAGGEDDWFSKDIERLSRAHAQICSGGLGECRLRKIHPAQTRLLGHNHRETRYNARELAKLEYHASVAVCDCARTYAPSVTQ